MLTAIAIVPSAPVMVPDLAGAAAAEVAGLREAVFAAASSLPPRWIAVGVGPADRPDTVVASSSVGTFAGYGADLRVALAPGGGGPPGPLPLCALIAGWVRDRVAPDATAEVRVYARDHGAGSALSLGRALRAQIDARPDPVGVLVVADGANTLTPAAPGGYDPDSAVAQDALDDALARGDVAALSRLDTSIVGRVAYQVLAGVAAPGPASASALHRSAPYGVGYSVGLWRPATAPLVSDE